MEVFNRGSDSSSAGSKLEEEVLVVPVEKSDRGKPG